ncbi:Lrp/AsnC family transcriptional regulator [Bifidobacterium aquikefiricola]|uniref:Lrp/AsnC family transcriptional regulator n=1 Tax=Bifidobacterium aquikefiricola TaxID=3059038 RepID=A0AB39U776_9BIFI
MTAKTNDTSREVAKPLLDDINKTIIKELQKDGRRSFVAIGKLVGLSEAAVRSRVQRLTDSGMIQIVAVTNPMQLGYHRQAMIGVTLSGALEPVVAELKAITNIDYIVVTAGRYDLLLEVFCVSDAELLDLVSTIRKLSGVNRTEIFTYLQLASEHYNFGVL